MLRLSSIDNFVRLGDHPGSLLTATNGTCTLGRVGSSLKAYQFRGTRLRTLWTADNIFGDGAVVQQGREGNPDNYPFFVGDLLNTGNKDIIIWRSDSGVKAAQLRSPVGSVETGLIPFKTVFRTETRFSDIYGWRQGSRTFLWDFFYGNESFGLFTRDDNGGPRFYILSKSQLNNRSPTFFKEITEVKDGLSLEWSAVTTDILLEKLGSEGGSLGARDCFLLWGKQGLSVYKFAGKNLELQLKAAEIIKKDKEDKLFVGDLHGSSLDFRDILISSEEGLKVFRYNSSLKGYLLTATYSESGPLYWKSLFGDSAMLADVNGDGKQELVFNGPQGIIAVSLEAIDSNSISGNLGSLWEWKRVLVTWTFGHPLAIVGSTLDTT